MGTLGFPLTTAKESCTGSVLEHFTNALSCSGGALEIVLGPNLGGNRHTLFKAIRIAKGDSERMGLTSSGVTGR